MITSPGSNIASSAMLIKLWVCSGVKSPTTSLSHGKACSKSWKAQRFNTSSTDSVNCTRELLAKARHSTTPFAFAPSSCRLPYMRPRLPKIQPGLQMAPGLRSLEGMALPETMMNIQSPTSPSRKITSPSANDCKMHALANDCWSASAKPLKFLSACKKASARSFCVDDNFSMHCLKEPLSICQSSPDAEQRIVAVRRIW
mmetsp:Transcript_116880/g.337748  ORF Transcript_116880/g.337748 Transcript_116880/m.337748 type:complete len:200 (+) Transcript_116880:1676-2275(+)